MIEAKDLAEALTKHLPGLHDQRSHGRRHVRRWEPLDYKQAFRLLTGRFYADRDAVNALLDNHDVYMVDGLMCIVEHPDRERFGPDDTSQPITPEMADHFLSSVHRLQKTNPIDKRFVVHLTETPFQAFGYADRPDIGGFTTPGARIVCVRPASATMEPMQWKAEKALFDQGFLMPAGGQAEPVDYLLAHEWGHAVYWSGDYESSAHLITRTFRNLEAQGINPLGGFSEYGASKPNEGYAEAFAQWVLAGWEPNRLAEILATSEGWTSFVDEPAGEPESDWTSDLPLLPLAEPQTWREAASPT